MYVTSLPSRFSAQKIRIRLTCILSVVLFLTGQAAPVAMALPADQKQVFQSGINYYDVQACGEATASSTPTVTAGNGSPTGLQFPNLDPSSMADAINSYIQKTNPNGKLNGLGATIVSSAKNANVSPFLVVAIAQDESQLADPSTYNVAHGNNPFGRTADTSKGQPSFPGSGPAAGTNWYKWSSVKASVDYTAPENQQGSNSDETEFLATEYGSFIQNNDLSGLIKKYDPNQSEYTTYIPAATQTIQQLADASGGNTSSATTMYDSAAPDQIPSDAKVVATYISNGPGVQYAKNKFPNATVVSINETPGNNGAADIWGIETGSGKTPQSTADAIANGTAHGAYGAQSDLDTVKSILNSKNVPRSSYVLWLWAAGTEGDSSIPAGDDAHQYKIQPGGAGYDVSSISSTFLDTLAGTNTGTATPSSPAGSNSTCCPPSANGSTPAATPAGSSGSTTFSANAQTAFNFFVQNGFSTAQAAGIIGNFQQESGVNPKSGDQNAGGIAGFTTGSLSMSSMEAWVTSHGEDPMSLQGQLDFILYYITKESPSIAADMKKQNDPQSAALTWENDFEGCLGSRGTGDPNAPGSCMQDQRIQYAQDAYSQLSSGAAGLANAGASCAGTNPALSPDCQAAVGDAKILCAAKQYDPASYVWGGGHAGAQAYKQACPTIGPSAACGVDCAGLVNMAVYDAFGVDLTEDTYTEASDSQYWQHIQLSQVQPGDLIQPDPGHVEIVDHVSGNTIFTFGAHTSNAPQADQVGPTQYTASPGYVYLHWIGQGSS